MDGRSSGASPRAASDAPAWAIRVVQDLVAWVEARGRGPQALTIYLKARLPDAAKNRGALIAVSDDVGGFTPAYSDGTAWRRTADGAVVS
jgi:hypothetical protein